MRGKKNRYAYNESASNIIQAGKPLFEKVKGNWSDLYFKNQNPIVLELACGRGEYTLGLAQQFPTKNFIGVDIKGDRLWKGSSMAIAKELSNVAFLRTFIHDLDKYFDTDEVSEIWITFPDPRPKDKDEKRRLTSERFLNLYQSVLQPDGWLKLKTDSTSLFEYTLELLQNRSDVKDLTYTQNLDESSLISDHFGITTHYERLFSSQGEKIKYLKTRFDRK